MPPSINQYVDALESSFGLFKTIGEIDVQRDSYGRVRIRSGNSAVVFKIFVNSTAHLLKCHIKPVRQIGKKYKYISALSSQCDYIADTRVLKEELCVYDYNGSGEYYDVVFAPWIEGDSLGAAIERAVEVDDKQTLANLANCFDRMALSLLEQDWAHGDVKPENIIVCDDGKLCLIDYDALYIPELSGDSTSEIGTQPYQHPLRGREMYDKHIDDYSIAIISVSLHAIAHDPKLYEKHHKADNIIFDARDVVAGNSEPFEEVIEMWSSNGESALYHLAKLLCSKTPYINDLRLVLRNVVCHKPSDDSGCLIPTVVGEMWGYVDENSRTVINHIYDKALPFSYGLGAVSLNGTHLFVDGNQNVIINCSDYTDIKPFNGGLAAVERDGCWGYIDMRGIEVIVPIFQMASSFREELAVVKYDDKYGYIDRHGKWHIEPVFSYAINFRNQVAEVEKDGAVVCIDKNNRII